MDRIRKLTQDPDYLHYLSLTDNCEVNRPFCRHDFSHLLDVARIAWILCLERGLAVPRALVYAAALLHDVGRFAQYENGQVDHAAASAELAGQLLDRHGFDTEEIYTIRQAIRAHRKPPETVADPFGAVLAEADDLARPCFDCKARVGCYKADRMPTTGGIQY